MRKLFLVMAVAALGICAVSCQKDGVYKPGKKIAQINGVYVNSVSGDTVNGPMSIWEWDGNLLKKITHFDIAEEFNGMTEVFNYNGKRLASVDVSAPYNGHADYIYDGKRLVRIEYTQSVESLIGEGDTITTTKTYEFTYDGNQLSKIFVTTTSNSPEEEKMAYSPLHLLLPAAICNNVNFCEAQAVAAMRENGAKASVTTTSTYDFTWENDNIIKMTYAATRADESSTTPVDYNYTYDNNPNPYQGLVCALDLVDIMSFNKNNIVTSHTILDGIVAGTMDRSYAYTYDDDDYPMSYDETSTVTIMSPTTSTAHYDIIYVE